MKEIIRRLLASLMRFLSLIFTYRVSRRIKGYCNLIYTLWIRNFLGKVDPEVSIHYPCLIQGGGEKGISIGKGTCLQGYNVLGCWACYKGHTYTPIITIGRGCNIGEYTHITAINKITIGDGLLTGRFVYIGDNAHGGLSYEESSVEPACRRLSSKGAIQIGNNVWIGDKVTILGGVTIGNNVIIAANAVVTKDLPDNCIAAGVPANMVKKLQ